MKKLLTIVFTILCISNLAFAEDIVKVKFIHGSVTAKLINGESKLVEANQNYPEGTVFKTNEASYIKLVFIDNSELIMAPNSLIKIASFSKNDAGIIHLIKGIIRSKVTKDYMNIDDKNKSKLLIRTNYAALGIRGTYFQVEYNEDNETTFLHMFQGKVAMNKIDIEKQKIELNQTELDKILNSKDRIMVTKGFMSKIEKNEIHPKAPSSFNLNKIKFNDKQFDLKIPNDENGKKPLSDKQELKNNREQIREDIKNELKDKRDELKEMRREEMKPENRKEEIQQMKSNLEKR